MPWRHSLILNICVLFLSFSSPPANSVDGGVRKRSLDADEAALINSLAAQLYKRIELDGIKVHANVELELEEKKDVVKSAVGKGEVVEKRSDVVKPAEEKGEVEATKRIGSKSPLEDGMLEEEKKRDAVKAAADKGMMKKKEENDENNADIDRRDSDDDDSQSNGGNNKTPTSTPDKDVVIAPLVAEGGSMDEKSHTYLLIMISVCCVFGVMALIGAALCYYNVSLHKAKAKEIPYMTSPVYEYTSVPSSANKSGLDNSYGSFSSDSALAVSAQKFHFQHEKEKLIAMEYEKSQMEPVSHLSIDCTDEVFETPGAAGMWDVEVECPAYLGEVTPGTTPRGHTPMMRSTRDSNDEGEVGEEGEDLQARLTNGAYINGDATGDHPNQNHHNINNNNNNNSSSSQNNISGSETNIPVNGTNGYH